MSDSTPGPSIYTDDLVRRAGRACRSMHEAFYGSTMYGDAYWERQVLRVFAGLLECPLCVPAAMAIGKALRWERKS